MNSNKPITLIREDFINGVSVLINESNLPLFIIEDSLMRIINDVSELSKHQIEHDRQTYMQSIIIAQTESDENENVDN